MPTESEIISVMNRFDPRLHFAAAIGWAVFAVVTLAALMSATLAAAQAEQRARSDAERLLAEFATQVRDAISMTLESRRALLQATSAQGVLPPVGDPAALRSVLLATQVRFPEFAWLGAANAGGHVVAETGASGWGADVSQLAWFQRGRAGNFASDPHALPPQTAAEVGPQAAGLLIDMAVPMGDGGALGAFVQWAWVEQQVTQMQQALSRSRRVELMLVARDGKVLVGPANWLGRTLGGDQEAAESGQYLVGARTQLRLADGLGLGWTAIVRQHADVALAPAKQTRDTVFFTVFAAGLLAAAAAVLATRLLTRRLAGLAEQAEAVRRGEQTSLVVPQGADEVSRIGATLAHAVDHLQAEKRTLQLLNVELDLRVAERTRRIERMAAESRHVAVTQERLRIARELHDTLAHSLMALLTQIRVVRKLGRRLDAASLDAELGRAEEVAAAGLVDSRAAIAQMRGNGVRETGLGTALRDLVRRMGERTGLAVDLQTDEAMAKASDEQAETAFHIVEEALRNVERHAAARHVRVTLGSVQAPGKLSHMQVEVADDGIGFDTAQRKAGHYGLRGMQEQAVLIGARLEVHSRPGQGTRLLLEFDT